MVRPPEILLFWCWWFYKKTAHRSRTTNRFEHVLFIGNGPAGIGFRLLIQKPAETALFFPCAARRGKFFLRHKSLLKTRAGLYMTGWPRNKWQQLTTATKIRYRTSTYRLDTARGRKMCFFCFIHSEKCEKMNCKTKKNVDTSNVHHHLSRIFRCILQRKP